jgi:nitroreductase
MKQLDKVEAMNTYLGPSSDSKIAVTVSDAVASRKSIRKFLSRPVQEHIIVDILDRARRAPSGGNLQPWQIHVLTGSMLEKIKDAVAEKLQAGISREEPVIDVYPRGLREPFRSRRHAAGSERYAAMGYTDKDPRGLAMLSAMNAKFFDAPVGMLFCLPKGMEPHQWCDLGLLMQTIMLLAVERELGTCPQAYWTNWRTTIGEMLGLPRDSILVAGMSLGYPDLAHPLNQYATRRADVDEFVVLHSS